LKREFDGLASDATVVSCEPDLGGLESLAAEHNVRFDRGALDVLTERSAGDPARMRADAERVMLYAAGARTITRADVEQVVGRPSAAGGRQLWSAVAGGQTAVALRELELELAEGAVPYMLLGLLRSVVERKILGPGVPAALDALLRTDLSLKTSGGDPRVLLERLVVELCDAIGRDGRRGYQGRP
jgi:DNA polymerase III delta subunit